MGTSTGQQFGRYRLRHLLGTGGMGQVYAADLIGPAGFRKAVAIKILRPDLSLTRPGAREALAREARLGGLLSHPNVVETYELGEHDGQLFVAMAWVRGPSLARILREHGPLSPRAAVNVAVQVCDGLAHIHELEVGGRPNGLVHRDLKPPNILVDRSGAVRIADLGIASLQDAVGLHSDRRGTLTWMAPEQIRGEGLDARADLFALGSILVELLTGWAPFAAVDDHVVAAHILDADATVVRRAVVPTVEAALPGLGDIVASLLRTDRVERAGSAREVGAALRALAPTGDPLTAFVTAQAQTFDDASTTADTVGAPVTASTMEAITGRPPTNVVPPADAFLGRDADLVALSQALGEARLVTLKGAGGTGKTRLATEFALADLRDWPGGAWWCDLTEARDLQGILFAVAEVLDVPIGKGDTDQLTRQLGHAVSARGRTLLVLDNFEQVVEHAPHTVQRWLAEAPEVRIVVTSREVLRIAGEHVIEVQPLGTEAAASLLLERTRGHSAWARPDPDVIDAIVARLDRLPLAIELAAARAPLMGPDTLLKRLDRPLGVLGRGRRGASSRQATLRGAIAWSWELLEAWEQAALAQLTVFRGGFFLDHAEAVLDLTAWADAPWAIDVVASLWDKSLVTNREVQGEPRFALYESVRAFATEHLAPGHPVHRAHAEAFAAMHTPGLRARLGSREAVTTLREITLEIDNLAAACRWAAEAGEGSLAAPCALVAQLVYSRIGPLAQGVVLLELALSAEPSPEAAMALHDAAWVLQMQHGRGASAQAHAEAQLALAEAHGDDEAIGRAMVGLATTYHANGLVKEAFALADDAVARIPRSAAAPWSSAVMLRGKLHTDLGRLTAAEADLETSIAISRQQGDLASTGMRLVALGLVYQHQTRYPESIDTQREAIDLLERTGNAVNAGRAHGNLAIVYRRLGRNDDARRHYEISLGIHRRVGNLADEAIATSNLGILCFVSGQHDEAERLYRASMAINARVGNRMIEAFNIANLGNLHRMRGETEAAADHYARAADIHESMGNTHYAALCRGDVAMLHINMGRPAEAERGLREAIGILREIGDIRAASNLMRGLAITFLAREDTTTAREVLLEFASTLDRVDDPELRIQHQVAVAEVELADGRHEHALAAIDRAVATAGSAERPHALARAHTLASEVYLAQGDLESALAAITRARTALTDDHTGQMREIERVAAAIDARRATLGPQD